MNILVTGGAGFVGTQVAKRLLELGSKIVIVDNFNDYYQPSLKEARVKNLLPAGGFSLERIDICDYHTLADIFKNNKFDLIVHIAAQAGIRYSLNHPFVYQKSNIAGTLNLLELARKYQVKKFIFASSSSVYGANKKFPFNENDRVDKPISLYAVTKRAGELMCYNYYVLYGLKVMILRFFTVYGPWGRPDMAYFKFCDKLFSGQAIEVYGQGEMERDFTYIDDIVEGVIKAIEYKYDYEIINLGNNKPERLEDLVSLIEQETGKKFKKNYLSRQPGDMRSTWADIEKAKKLLAWQPRVDLKGGIKKFVAWYRDYYHV